MFIHSVRKGKAIIPPDCMYVCVSEKCTLYAHDLIRVINFIPQREKRSKLR